MALGVERAATDAEGVATLGVIRVESTLIAAPFYQSQGFIIEKMGYYAHEEGGPEIPVVQMLLSPARTPLSPRNAAQIFRSLA